MWWPLLPKKLGDSIVTNQSICWFLKRGIAGKKLSCLISEVGVASTQSPFCSNIGAKLIPAFVQVSVVDVTLPVTKWVKHAPFCSHEISQPRPVRNDKGASQYQGYPFQHLFPSKIRVQRNRAIAKTRGQQDSQARDASPFLSLIGGRCACEAPNLPVETSSGADGSEAFSGVAG